MHDPIKFLIHFIIKSIKKRNKIHNIIKFIYNRNTYNKNQIWLTTHKILKTQKTIPKFQILSF